MNPPSNISRIGNVLYVLAFVLLLWVPLAAQVFQLERRWGFDRVFKLEEKRVLATLPDVKTEPIRSLPKKFDAHFNDCFGFRAPLVQAYNTLKLHVFRVSPSEQVLLGKQGWLYYTSQGQIEDYQGLRTLSAEELAHWKCLLEGKREWLASRGIRYLFVVAPDKTTIYPEYLPDSVRRVPNARTRLDQLVAYLRENSDFEILDLRPLLLEARQSMEVYGPNDSHWYDCGGVLAYRQICRRIGQWFPEIRPLGDEDLAAEPISYPGDLSLMLGVTRSSSPWTLWVPRQGRAKPAPIPNLLAASKKFSSVPEVRENPSARRRLVVFRDSFMNHAPIECLAEHFRRSVFLGMFPGADFDDLQEVVEKERPDVVIEQWVERKLGQVRKIPIHPELARWASPAARIAQAGHHHDAAPR